MSISFIEITGLGCICAPGDSVVKAMESLYCGKRNPAEPTNFKTDLEIEYPVFEVSTQLAKSDTEITRTTQLTMHAVDEALQQAGLTFEKLNDMRVGVAMGTTVGCTLNNEPFYRDFRSGKNPDLSAITRFLGNNPALYLAKKYQLKGPVATIANACSSGTDAIGLAKSWLENDLCDIVIAGGADELTRITYLGFISLLVSSSEACRPFDKNRKGLNLGEGAGIVILEKSESIKKRSAKSLAKLVGYGTYADAYHPTAPHPEGLGLKKAINQALKEGQITKEQIDFINAHGTSTQNNDEVEGKVIGELFPHKPPVVSTKAYTGHTLGAAGGIEAVFTVKALQDQMLPATTGFEEFDPNCAISPTTVNVKIKTEYALSNSLAFGGNNSTLLFRRIS